jgi:hypothetical protein
MMNADRYTYRVLFSAEDGEHVATVAEFPSLSWLADNPVDAFTGIKNLVTSIINDMRGTGEEPPTPLGEREYSGVPASFGSIWEVPLLPTHHG